jgi:hypothetical protein
MKITGVDFNFNFLTQVLIRFGSLSMKWQFTPEDGIDVDVMIRLNDCLTCLDASRLLVFLINLFVLIINKLFIGNLFFFNFLFEPVMPQNEAACFLKFQV